MKLRELSLLRFGPFTDVRLDFSERPGALQIVYGPNEAGKSTALRAITALLYGVPEKTGDAHLHAMKDLRVGALLDVEGGALEIVRRKGRKQTLRDASDEPIDEAMLSRHLGGVGREAFLHSYGLDADVLRAGGRALLEGHGDVGQSLFDAGTGAAAVQRLLAELATEADELYTPRASTKRINAGLKLLKEKKTALKNALSLPRKVAEQQRQLEDEMAKRDALEAERRALRTEQARITRLRNLIPPLQRRAKALADRAALGDVPRLPSDARARLERLQDVETDRNRRLKTLQERIARAEAAVAAHVVPDAVLALDETELATLVGRAGSDAKAFGDLPKRRAELDGVRAALTELARQLGMSVDHALALTLTEAERARIDELIATPPADRGELSRELESRRAELEQREDALSRAPAAVDCGALEQALSGVRRAGDLEVRLEQASAAVAAAEMAREAAFAPLAAWAKGDVTRLPLPGEETVRTFGERLAELEREQRELDKETRAAAKRERELARREAELSAGGTVPSEGELSAARAHRDAGFALIERALAGETVNSATWDGSRPLPRAFEQAMNRADEVADQLRRDADRVAQRARIEADRAALADERAEISARAADAAAARAAWQSEWARAWEALGEPRAPREMLDIVRQIASAKAAAADHDDATASHAALAKTHAALLAALAKAARTVGLDVSDGPTLDALADTAERFVGEQRARADTAEREQERALRLRSEVSSLEQKLSRSSDDEKRWRAAWAAAVAPLGLDESVTPKVALAVLRKVGEVSTKRSEAAQLEKRIAGIERDHAELVRDVRALAARAGVDVPEGEERALVQRLSRERSDAQRAADAREKDRTRLKELRDEATTAELERAEASAALAELCAAAAVRDVSALPEVIARVEQRDRVETELLAAERTLHEQLQGLTLEQAEAETADFDVTKANVRLVELESELEALDERHQQQSATVARIEAGLASYDRDDAANLAAELQTEIAALKLDIERWMRAKLAQAILSREVEHYREQNQGPILTRAEQLFVELTERRYTGLRARITGDEHPVLVCLRPRDASAPDGDQDEIDVEGLSEGTRDQLYLALRLASYERAIEHNPPLPLVLDDVLTSFDEGRTRAALRVLADVARKGQVLLFTHHAHVVELAREALPVEGVVVHELSRRRVDAAGQAVLRA